MVVDVGGPTGPPAVAGRRRRPAFRWVALALFAVLVAVADRYGWHRDELYLVEAGLHPALSYPDQPAPVPLLAAWWEAMAPGDLRGFRVLPAAAAALVVVAAGLTSRELGGDERDQVWTSVVVATATTLLVAGHLFSTTVFDMALTSLAVWLLVRAVRREGPGAGPAWLLAGLVAALALAVKTLPLLVLGCCVLALLLVGPRAALRTPWPYLAALVAATGLVPTLAWQAANGWPQLGMASSIAAGGSGTSTERWALPLLLPTLTGVTFVLVVVGAVALWRRTDLCWVPLAAGLLVVALVVTGGKPYYAFGLVPVLTAAGVAATRRWERAGSRRRGALAGLVGLNAVASAFIGLPLLPPSLAPVAVVADHGEQVGWPAYVDAVADVADASGAALVLTQNYGQAGALDQARRQGRALPPVASGHTGYWWWSRPVGEPATVVVVGWRDPAPLETWFAACEPATTVPDAGVDNEESGTPVRVCTDPRLPWASLWPELRRVG